MKKAIILAAVGASAISSLANAAAICSAATAATNGATVTAATDTFVKVTFTPKCSANVLMAATQNAVAMGVVSGSNKGKNYFGGSTNGGGVSPMGSCPTSGCTTTQVSDTNADTKRDAS